MPAIVLDILKYLFLFLIFIFLARAVRAMYLDIAGPRAAASPKRPAQTLKARPSKPPERLSVVEEDSKPRTFDIGEELIIGRGDKCHVVIKDTYASQVHARVFVRDDVMFIEDMGSTNGTYLNKRKVSTPTPVSRGDRARIGKTEMEFRR